MSIIKRLGRMLEGRPAVPTGSEDRKTDDEKLAAAALMVEVATRDGEFSRREREHILYLLEHRLGLSSQDALELFVEALATQNKANHMLDFTRKIKDHFDEAGRENILELLWEVVFADEEEDAYESNLMRRVTGLLYISDRRSGILRKKVKARLNKK